MLRRIRELFNDVLRQADLLLLALCGGASLFGVLMVSSATRYMHTNRLVLVQAAALVIGVLLYLLVSQIDVGDVLPYFRRDFGIGRPGRSADRPAPPLPPHYSVIRYGTAHQTTENPGPAYGAAAARGAWSLLYRFLLSVRRLPGVLRGLQHAGNILIHASKTAFLRRSRHGSVIHRPARCARSGPVPGRGRQGSLPPAGAPSAAAKAGCIPVGGTDRPAAKPRPGRSACG